MKKTCEECANCYKEYMLGGYPTPVCKIYGYLEETNNPHHDLDGEKCPDYTILRGLRAKIKPIDDWEVPEELKEMIKEIVLMEDILDCNNCECSDECENCARAIEDRGR